MSAGRSYSGDLDDLAIAWQSSLEANGDGSGVLEVDRIHALHVDVGFGAVARVAALTQLVSDGNGLKAADRAAHPRRRHPTVC
jgi:hypothetical protein